MKKKALAAIEKNGALLVFPIKNKAEPDSIWSVLYPRSKMRWEWDENGDSRVSDLWILREELSRSKKVIYTKWYQGRATFFSREVFVNLLAYLRSEKPFSKEAQNILDGLEMDSPLSTKQIKVMAELQGKWLEASYNRAMKQLWNRLQIVAFGEVDDSSFPSLAVGATKILFEDLWLEAQKVDPRVAEKFLARKLGADNKFWLFAQNTKVPASLSFTRCGNAALSEGKGSRYLLLQMGCELPILDEF